MAKQRVDDEAAWQSEDAERLNKMAELAADIAVGEDVTPVELDEDGAEKQPDEEDGDDDA